MGEISRPTDLILLEVSYRKHIIVWPKLWRAAKFVALICVRHAFDVPNETINRVHTQSVYLSPLTQLQLSRRILHSVFR